MKWITGVHHERYGINFILVCTGHLQRALYTKPRLRGWEWVDLFFLLEPSRCVFTKHSTSKSSQNTTNLLSIKVATCFDSRSQHQANYWTMYEVHYIYNIIYIKIYPRAPLRKTWIYFTIWYICWLKLGCHPVAVVQYTFTHKQYTAQHK